MSMDLLMGGARWALLLSPVVLSFVTPARAADPYAAPETAVLSYEAGQFERAPTAPVYGPFRVVSESRAELVDGIDAGTPNQFAAMIAAHPAITRIDMVECPGSEDDDANLIVARMIRAAGLAMHVPSGGSIRSGGVELFLAGKIRTADRGAEIGVHSWQDSEGLEADDYAPSDAVHQPYLAFYQDIGMTQTQARAFYDFTNRAASFDDLHVMTDAEVKHYGLLTTP